LQVEKFAQHAFIAHVDVDPKEIGKIKAVQMGINADVGDVLNVLNVMLAHDSASHRLHTTDDSDEGALPTVAQRAWVDELRREDAKCPMTYHTKEIGGKIRFVQSTFVDKSYFHYVCNLHRDTGRSMRSHFCRRWPRSSSPIRKKWW
jgi:thiamine pyrophosphate-dependent acetolactate synthase large subunit-like protein